ncbi:PAS domain-containing protein [Mariprofundus erugo]|nr:PAS domain-containing protein [Mariprofundus erugo]
MLSGHLFCLLSGMYDVAANSRIRLKMPDNWGRAHYFAAILLPAIVLVSAIAWLIYCVEANSRINLQVERNMGTIALQKKGIEQELSRITSDLLYLSREVELIVQLRQGSDDLNAILAGNLADFASTKKLYDQVRLIDNDGMERIRINANGGHAGIVPDSALQSKKDHYYYTAASGLAHGEIYVSPLDLNVEHQVVEVPYKPVIRLATPIFDQRGNRLGILMLNYLGQHLLDNFAAVNGSALTESYLLNRDGYWLYAREHALEWGFMLNDRQSFQFQHAHAAAWHAISGTESGQLRNDDGLYCYTVIKPLAGMVTTNGTALSWRIVAYDSASRLHELLSDTRLYALLWGGVSILLIGIIAWFLAVHLVREKREHAKVRKLSQAIEQAGESIIITDRWGIVEYVNPAFTEMTGYLPEEIINNNPRILSSGKQDRRFYEQMWDTLKSGQSWQGRIVDRKKDGTLFPAVLTVSPIFDASQVITHYIGLQQNLQAYEELEARFQQAQKMEAIGTLVGGIAHDFNNTLAGITGNLFLLKRRASGQPELLSRIDSIETLSQRASGMIQQLLAFSRRNIISKQPIYLPPFIKETVRLHEVSIPASIKFNVQVTSEKLYVSADANQLQQMLLNLVNNARDALESTIKPVITVELRRYEADQKFCDRHQYTDASEFACITVRDNGSGIEAEHLNQIFEPFFTTKEVDRGTGLGLAMVYGSVQSHGGAIEVESEPAHGTAFHIYLPLIRPKDGELLSSKKAEDEPCQGHGETILLVDDDSTLVTTHRDILQGMNYKVVVANDGIEAVRQFRLHRDEISLVILDVVMPGMSGVDALKQMRAITPHIACIFTTGYDRMKVIQCEVSRSETVLAKPYDIYELSRLIHEKLTGISVE